MARQPKVLSACSRSCVAISTHAGHRPSRLPCHTSSTIPQARKDGQAARTQLQLANKANPSLIQRFFIYKVGQLEASTMLRPGGLGGSQSGREALHDAAPTHRPPGACGPPPPHHHQTQDLAKKLKESGGLDLMGYIEFQRCVVGGGGLALAWFWGRAGRGARTRWLGSSHACASPQRRGA